MSDKEMNLAILNKLYEIADKVFNEGVNVKEGNYTASDLAKMKDSAPAKDVAETKVDAPDAPDAPAKIVPLDKHSNKFSFDAIGVNVGDKLTFIDGTEVIAAEDNKVSFCGELFTLSGFCKEFMPDDKRTKSNTYRGCVFFFKDGVKLELIYEQLCKYAESETDCILFAQVHIIANI